MASGILPQSEGGDAVTPFYARYSVLGCVFFLLAGLKGSQRKKHFVSEGGKCNSKLGV